MLQDPSNPIHAPSARYKANPISIAISEPEPSPEPEPEPKPSPRHAPGAKPWLSVLEKYVLFCTNTHKADKIVKLIGYTALLSSCLLRNRPAGTVPAKVLRDIYYHISLSRCVFRIIGTTESLHTFITPQHHPSPSFSEYLSRLEGLALVPYHALEHVCWLGYASKHMEWINPDKWSRWSDYFWLLFIIINILKVHQELTRVNELVNSTSNDGKERPVLEEELQLLRLQQIRNVFYLPNAVHWAAERPLLTDYMVGTFGLAEAVVGIVQAWKATKC